MNEDQLSDFRRDNLGFVFQDFNLLDTLTVQGKYCSGALPQGKHGKGGRGKDREVMDILDISSIQDKFPYQISGGQKQRCACAQALVTGPRLILADEPTGALDSKSSLMLMETFHKLNTEMDSTIPDGHA